MKIEDRRYNTGIVVPSITDVEDIALSRFLKVLHPISGRMYVVAGSATPKKYDWVRVYLIREEVVQRLFIVSTLGLYRLDDDPRQAVTEQGFRKLNEWRSVSGFVKLEIN